MAKPELKAQGTIDGVPFKDGTIKVYPQDSQSFHGVGLISMPSRGPEYELRCTYSVDIYSDDPAQVKLAEKLAATNGHRVDVAVCVHGPDYSLSGVGFIKESYWAIPQHDSDPPNTYYITVGIVKLIASNFSQNPCNEIPLEPPVMPVINNVSAVIDEQLKKQAEKKLKAEFSPDAANDLLSTHKFMDVYGFAMPDENFDDDGDEIIKPKKKKKKSETPTPTFGEVDRIIDFD